MRHFKTIFITLALAALSLAASCVKHTSRGDTFEAEFRLVTDSFFDGDEFQFIIKANREKIKVVDFDFKLAPKMIAINETYSLTDGVWAPTAVVRVPQTQRGKLKIKIMDPKTGDTREFSGSYQAFQSSGVSLTIDNKPVSTSKKISHDYPLIVDGDAFQFTLHSSSENLVLKAFKCEFNDGTLKVGDEYTFVDNNRKSFSIPLVGVYEDALQEPLELSMTLNNPETGRDTTVRAYYLKALPLTPSVVIEPSQLNNGDVATVKIYGNRESFQLADFTHPTWFELKNISKPYECKPGINGYVAISTSTLIIPNTESGTMSFAFVDNMYTERQVTVSAAYSAQAAQSPQNVEIDSYNASLSVGETAVFEVSTTDEYSTKRFKAGLLSGAAGSLKFYIPKSDSETPEGVKDEAFSADVEFTAGRLFVRSFGTGGASAFRVSAVGRQSVYKDVDIFVKYNVALVIQGYFENWMEPDPYNQLDHSFGPHMENKKVGWYGFPTRDMTMQLMLYQSTASGPITGLSPSEAATYLRLNSLPQTPSTQLAVTSEFVLKDKTNEGATASKFFFGTYSPSDHVCLNGEKDPRYWLYSDRITSKVIMSHDYYNQHYEGWPASMFLYLDNSISESGSVQSITCKSLTELVKNLDCNVSYQIDAPGKDYAIDAYDAYEIFSSARLNIVAVSYDKEMMNLKYIIYQYKLPDGKHGTAEPWWANLDNKSEWIREWK